MAKEPITDEDINGLMSTDSKLIIRATKENHELLIELKDVLVEIKEVLEEIKEK